VGAVTGAFELQDALSQTTEAMQQVLALLGKLKQAHKVAVMVEQV
jgi:sarcosine oxidase subunit alpha